MVLQQPQNEKAKNQVRGAASVAVKIRSRARSLATEAARVLESSCLRGGAFHRPGPAPDGRFPCDGQKHLRAGPFPHPPPSARTAGARLLRLRSRFSVRPGAANSGLEKGLFRDVYEDVTEKQKKDMRRNAQLRYRLRSQPGLPFPLPFHCEKLMPFVIFIPRKADHRLY